jgi:hypothetical protein
VNEIVTHAAGWHVAISLDATYVTFAPESFMHATRDAGRSGGSTNERRAVVEVCRGAGGIFPRAAPGARYSPGGHTLTIIVATIGDMCASAVGDFASVLATPMTIGLPQEFGNAVLNGLTSFSDGTKTPTGDLNVDFAAYDEVNSSPYAVEHAARLLLWVFAQHESRHEIDSCALVTELETRWATTNPGRSLVCC